MGCLLERTSHDFQGDFKGANGLVMFQQPIGHHATIHRRQVFHIPGYDPANPDTYFRRFSYQLNIFKLTWNIAATITKPTGPQPLSYDIAASGPDWHVQTTHTIWDWHDVVAAQAAIPMLKRWSKAAATYLDLLLTGTLWRYLQSSVRYGLFALSPLLQVGFLAICSWLFAYGGASALGLSGAANFILTVMTGCALFAGLLRWQERRGLQQALDDWIFAREYLLGRQPNFKQRLSGFADELAACARDSEFDEIVIVGHSLGATFAIEIVADVLKRYPDISHGKTTICVLTVGATIPKFALHPAAQDIRANVATVANDPTIFWAEYHSRGDAISFYKFDPVSLKKVHERLHSSPVIRRTQIHDMLRPETFKLYRYRVLRLHYQSVMANDRPALYDYFMMNCAPIPFPAWTVAPQGFLDFIDPRTGALVLKSEQHT